MPVRDEVIGARYVQQLEAEDRDFQIGSVAWVIWYLRLPPAAVAARVVEIDRDAHEDDPPPDGDGGLPLPIRKVA